MACGLLSRLALAMLVLAPVPLGGIAPSTIKPSEPIAGVLEAFQTRRLVGIPDAHRNTATHAFLLSLIRDRRFPTVVNDVVVECGNARYQDVADRFVRGEDVPYETLRKVWLDTTQAQPGCDTPQPEEVIRTVRAVNAPLRRAQQIRVLLGDPPIPSGGGHDQGGPPEVDRNARALPFGVDSPGADDGKAKSLTRLRCWASVAKKSPGKLRVDGYGRFARQPSRRTYGARVFNVGLTLDLEKERPYVATWPVPSLVVLRGTDSGAAPVPYDGPRVSVRSGRIKPVRHDRWRSIRLEERSDALLCIGPRTSWSYAMVSPALCADPTYKWKCVQAAWRWPSGRAINWRTTAAASDLQ